MRCLGICGVEWESPRLKPGHYLTREFRNLRLLVPRLA